MRYAIINAATGLVEAVAVWDGESDWSPGDGLFASPSETAGIGDTYDPISETFTPPPAPSVPVRATKSDFQRLFTPMERYALNGLRKEIAALTPADYADPGQTLLLAAEDVMFAFEQPLEFIELDHPETAQGLALLAHLGAIEAHRVGEIIGGQAPA